MIWWLTKIYVCKDCGYSHEFSELPEDDNCPQCKVGRIWRQVMQDGALVPFNPKKHN